MKKSVTIFLQIVVVFLGIGALALLLWEPWLEGVNARATTISQIYFDDPFLMLVYAGAIPFFIALYQTLKILGRVRRDETFSQATVQAVRTIRYCALAIIGFVAIEECIIVANRGSDDIAGGVFMGVLIAFGSVVVAAVAAVFEKTVQHAVDMKSENDLTV